MSEPRLDQIDTSGHVLGLEDERGVQVYHYFSELAEFTQGTVAEMLREMTAQDLVVRPEALFMARYPRFFDLSGEALERVKADCGRWQEGPHRWVNTQVAGQEWWRTRQRGDYADLGFPPLMAYQGDDRLIHFREG